MLMYFRGQPVQFSTGLIVSSSGPRQIASEKTSAFRRHLLSLSSAPLFTKPLLDVSSSSTPSGARRRSSTCSTSSNLDHLFNHLKKNYILLHNHTPTTRGERGVCLVALARAGVLGQGLMVGLEAPPRSLEYPVVRLSGGALSQTGTTGSTKWPWVKPELALAEESGYFFLKSGLDP